MKTIKTILILFDNGDFMDINPNSHPVDLIDIESGESVLNDWVFSEETPNVEEV